MSTFRITKGSARENIQGTYPTAAPRGFAVGPGASDGVLAAAASGKFFGFLTRDVTVDGPLLTDKLLSHMDRDIDDFPFKAGNMVSAEAADQLEVAGSGYIDDTNPIDENSVIGVGVSFLGGKFREAQAGDIVYYNVTAILGQDEDEDYIIQLTRAAA